MNELVKEYNNWPKVFLIFDIPIERHTRCSFIDGLAPPIIRGTSM